MFATLSFSAVSSLYASPSTQIWNPSTDIQAAKTFHLNIDNYFNDTASQYYYGVEYGLFKNLEVGFDLNQPSKDPLYLNAKYGIPESKLFPAVAVGIQNAGTKKDVTDYNMLFGVLARTFNPVGRLSLGYYSGSDKLLLDENGEKANTGAIVSWDKSITDKVWASVDYASGSSSYGFLTFGASYAFAPNTSVIFGYLIPNNYKVNTSGNQITTQLDINF